MVRKTLLHISAVFFLLIATAFFLVSCHGWNTEGESGAVWLDDPVMASGIDVQRLEPVDVRTTFPITTTKVYCFERIKGPERVILGVHWYKDDELIAQNTIEFGPERKSYAVLARMDGAPLGAGNYRCEIYATSKPLRTVDFTIK